MHFWWVSRYTESDVFLSVWEPNWHIPIVFVSMWLQPAYTYNTLSCTCSGVFWSVPGDWVSSMVGLLVTKPWGAKKRAWRRERKPKKAANFFSELIADSLLRTQNRFTRVDANESYNIQLHFAKKMSEKIEGLQDLWSRTWALIFRVEFQWNFMSAWKSHHFSN